MWLELGRRVSMIMLIVAFATGISVPTVKAQSHHGQMIASMTMSADHLANCAQDGKCPIDQNTDMHGTCFATGAGVSALSATTAIYYFGVANDVLGPSLDRDMVGHTIPPDPHPPKQYALI
jgi:hypothetical protein